MVISNLDEIFHLKSIALVGASDEKDSVGYILMENLTKAGYSGKVYLVNIREHEILGLEAYESVGQIPETVDLAIIATPAKTVLEVVEQCGEAKIPGLIIISAGFKEVREEGKALEDKIIELKNKYNMRIIGPNCLGIIRPDINLNTTFWTKPIIVVKAGRFSESAKAAASHTGSLAGEDMVYEAAFKRAGIVRVEEIADLFNCAEVLGLQPLPKRQNLVIITNADGPGVMAADALLARKGKLAKLGEKTMEILAGILPRHWSKGNPIDLLGDAGSDRYKASIEACFRDENIDSILVIYTPQGTTDPADVARNIVEVVRNEEHRKTILTSFMGYEGVEEANHILIDNNIPTYSTPEQAVATFMYMYQYKRNLELLYETPAELPVNSIPPRRPLEIIIRNAAKNADEAVTMAS